MIVQKPYTIALPYERGEQIKAILEAKQTSIVAYLVDSIRREISAGTIPDTVPDFHISKHNDGFLIGFGDEPKEHMTYEIAKLLSDAIYDAATIKEKYSPRHVDRHFVVARLAGSVKITVPANGITRRFNHDLAKDIARQIDQTIDTK